MQNSQFLKVKDNILELEQFFMELKEGELKDREEKIKREIKELFCKLIIVSKVDMDKFEEEEINNIRPIKKVAMIG